MTGNKNTQKIVIVGGVAGGATAAARIRRLDEHADIVVFERSGFISYANCGLPYYIGGVIKNKEELTLQTPKSFYERFRIKMNVLHEVKAIDPSSKTVTVCDLATGKQWEESYDKLLLSPGARPVVPQIPGSDLGQVYSLRTVEDTYRIRQAVTDEKPASALISGGGFIGLELAENLLEAGIKVTLIQRPDQVMKPLDREMASFIHNRIREAGIDLILGDSVVSLAENKEGLGKLRAELNSGRSIDTDMAIMAIGVAPETTLAKEAGLETGIKGSILVDDHMRTSNGDIYAVGDAVQVKQFTTGSDALISLAGPANRQGRIAADNICGLDSSYPGSQGSSVIKLFDMTIASTGINEKTAVAEGLEYEKIYLSPLSHAGYYPGGKVMTVKLVFDPVSDKILGAQIVGHEGVDKRIDVIATAMYAGIPASKLKELDLAYAPPYSSAKDPVNMAGFMVENIEKGLMKQFFYEDLESLSKDEGVTLLDTRTPEEYKKGHVDGFINIQVDELRERIGELDPSKPVYVMCQSGLRSYIACRILAQNGFECSNFSGGYRLYASVAFDRSASEEAFPCGMEK